ncbi:MAG: HAD-IA family hydrolase [Candidatus Binatia bacterium]|nr:HAD-IA family hydrolase [Candidatus Binatia bacterium]
MGARPGALNADIQNLDEIDTVCFVLRMPIRAVSLDFGWTLAYPRQSMWEILAEVCGEAGTVASPAAIESFVRSVWSVGQQRAEEELRKGVEYSDSDEQFNAQFRFLGELVFQQLGVCGEREALLGEFFRRFWNPEHWSLFSDVKDAVRMLRAKGLRVGVTSNAPSNMPVLLERLDLLDRLDFVVVSAAEGVRKPDKRIFVRALRRAGVQADETVHLGDMYVEDLLGGRNAGLATFLMERGKHALFPSFRESEGREVLEGEIVQDLEQFVQRVLDRL